MKTGRNDPCPCGSGKEFKKCCMLRNVATSTELHYRRLSEAYNTLFERLAEHAGIVLGVDGGKPALSDYFLLDHGIEPEEEIHERQMGLFLPWMLFNWEPRSNLRTGEHGRTIAEHYAGEKGHLLGELDRKLIEAVNRKPYTFYEILDVEPGKRVHLREVFTEDTISVEERSGSKQLKPADLVFGRAVVVDGVGMIIGLSSYAIPPRYKPSLIELRRRMKKKGAATVEFLKWETKIREAYLNIDRALFSPPQLCNTDGDPLEFHKLLFEIESAEEAFVELAPLCATASAQELRRWAKKDSDGDVLSAEIHWSRKGHKMTAAMDNTLLGNMLIQPRRLTVTVNSANRARTIRKEIESRLGERVRFRLDEIQDTGAMMAEFSRQGAVLPKDPKKDSLMQNPEVRRLVAAMMKEQWERWVDEKIPALGGRTPRSMVRTKDGREAVEALLADAERRTAGANEEDGGLEGIRRARELLGLKKDPLAP